MPTDFNEITNLVLNPYMLLALGLCIAYFIHERYKRAIDTATMMASIEKHRVENHPSESLNYNHMKEWAVENDSGFNEFLEGLEEECPI